MESISQPSKLVGSRAVFIYTLISILSVPLLLSIGKGGPLLDRVISALFISLDSGWIPLVYIIASLGFGRIARKWTSDLKTRWVIELGIGLTLLLSLSHLLGAFGLLNPISAWISVGIGCILVFTDLRQYAKSINTSQGQTTLSIPGVFFVISCVFVVLLACNPPGTLWDSEFGGYDSLSYHLELPREWLETGRIEPVAHNVYSYLPGYFESAYLHFAYLVDTPSTTSQGLSGLLANDARIAMSTHLFSAFLVIISACALRAIVDRMIFQCFPNQIEISRHPGLLARLVFASTPWIVVVGSLSYNEIGVLILAICAIAVVIEESCSRSFRSIASATIVAGACCMKPTALFMLAPAIAILLFSYQTQKINLKLWLKPVVLGLFTGVIVLTPWLIRNETAAGNPVFPQLSSLFGSGHWNDSQHSTYSIAHQFDGSFLNRIKLLLLPDSSGTHHVSRFRGFTNIQWSIVPALGSFGTLFLVIRPATRRIGCTLFIASVIPIIAWLMLTHLQSRFLISLAPFFIIAISLSLASIHSRRAKRLIVDWIAGISFLWFVIFVSTQASGNPFSIIDLGTSIFTGESKIEQDSNSPWSSKLNSILEPHETVYLLGDANPFYIRSPLIYNTVYDQWFIENAITKHPDSPTLWTQTLIDLDIDVVVISFSEINRFAQSGWLPSSIDPILMREWIDSLPEPIYVWTLPNDPTQTPIRAVFRIER
ncbi:MAG: hypothetical protein P1U42_11460 [Phycisphaerales bacterium]|nr:hypothetical protein [Phycisphaerales bacterium]